MLKAVIKLEESFDFSLKLCQLSFGLVNKMANVCVYGKLAITASILPNCKTCTIFIDIHVFDYLVY